MKREEINKEIKKEKRRGKEQEDRENPKRFGTFPLDYERKMHYLCNIERRNRRIITTKTIQL